MPVPRLARIHRKQERNVRIVRVEDEQFAQIVPVIAGHDGKVGVELVVGLREEGAIGAGEYPYDIGEDSIQSLLFVRIEDDREREVPKCLPISEDTEAITETSRCPPLRASLAYSCAVWSRLS